MTDQTDPVRIPIGRNITYAVRGMPEVPNAYWPGFLIPTEVSLTYRAAEDSQLGRFHAYVKGQWRRDGEVVPSGEKLPGQHYYGDPSSWPEWLAEEARLHDPDGLLAKVDEATATLRRIRSTIRTLKDRGATGYAYYQAITDDLAGPRPDHDEASGPGDMADEAQQPKEADPFVEPHCDGFPGTCPNPVNVPPAPPHHDGGIRCGCYDEPAAAQPKEA